MLFAPHKKTRFGYMLTLGIIVAFVCVGIAPLAQTAFAQASGPTPGPQVNPFTGQPAGQVAPPAPAPAPAPTETKPADCGWGIYCNLELLGQNLANWVATALLTFGGLILYLAGILLKAALEYTIVNMTSIVNATADGTLGATIRAIWIIFRDIANMFFIFILLYAAIGTILDLGGVNMKKILRNVIIVAILLNFSLFFTKILVDASNILAITFYNKIIGAVGGDNGIGGVFMQQFGLTSLFDVKGASEVIRAIADNGTIKMLEVGVAGLIFMLVAAFIFFAMSIMFIRRFVAIIFIFMLSPLAFAAMALPNDKYSSRWWKSLWNQLLFPPACLALLWVVLQIQTAVTKHGSAVVDSTTTLTSIVAGKGGSAFSGAGDLLMNFVILTVFTVAVLVIANELGAAGASSLMKTGKKWRQNAQGYVGRAAVRASGANLADRKLFGGEFGKSKIGRGIQSVTTGALRNQSFGSSQSVSKVDKEVKKRNEDYVKEVEKGTEKALEKKLPDLRQKRIAEINARTPNIDTEIAAAERDRITAEGERERAEAKIKTAAASGLAVPAKDMEEANRAVNEAKRRADEARTRANDLANEKKRIASERTGLEERVANKNVATKEERQQWLKPIQLEKAEQLDKKPTSRFGKAVAYVASKTMLPSEKKMAAKKLRENARGAGGKDIKATLEELLEQEGQAPAKPAEAAPKTT